MLWLFRTATGRARSMTTPACPSSRSSSTRRSTSARSATCAASTSAPARASSKVGLQFGTRFFFCFQNAESFLLFHCFFSFVFFFFFFCRLYGHRLAVRAAAEGAPVAAHRRNVHQRVHAALDRPARRKRERRLLVSAFYLVLPSFFVLFFGYRTAGFLILPHLRLFISLFLKWQSFLCVWTLGCYLVLPSFRETLCYFQKLTQQLPSFTEFPGKAF